jgi:YaiO family outer membrane protein
MMSAIAFSLHLLGAASDTTATLDSARSLTVPPWREVGVTASGEAFASRLSAWQWHTVSIRYRGRSTSHAFEAFTARRYDRWGAGAAFEETRTIGRGAYVAFRAQFAPTATVIPKTDIAATWFQSVGHGWEVIPSGRLMTFTDDRVPIWGLGVGRYSGLWYAAGRIADAANGGVHGRNVSANVRRYAADASPNLIDVSAAYGDEILALETGAVTLRRTKSAAARAQRMLSSSFGASLALSYDANASLPDRRGAAVSLFARW